MPTLHMPADNLNMIALTVWHLLTTLECRQKLSGVQHRGGWLALPR